MYNNKSKNSGRSSGGRGIGGGIAGMFDRKPLGTAIKKHNESKTRRMTEKYGNTLSEIQRNQYKYRNSNSTGWGGCNLM